MAPHEVASEHAARGVPLLRLADDHRLPCCLADEHAIPHRQPRHVLQQPALVQELPRERRRGAREHRGHRRGPLPLHGHDLVLRQGEELLLLLSHTCTARGNLHVDKGVPVHTS